MKVILTVGASASGKTTWAVEHVRKSGGRAINVNRDDIRFSLFGITKWSQYKFTTAREDMVTEAQFQMASKALKNGVSVIVSDTNLAEGTRQKWVNFAAKHNAEVELKFFHCELKELLARNLSRGDRAVGPDVIKKQHTKFMMQFGGWKTYTPDTNLPKAVIFDVDGTLVDNTERGPFEWHRVKEDTKKDHVHMLWHSMKEYGYVCIVVSGRDGVCQKDTTESLEDMGVFADAHFQRKEGDCRRDDIVKEEIFWEHIAPNYNVQLVVDDRQQVVDMWRRLGIETWQVDTGDF